MAVQIHNNAVTQRVQSQAAAQQARQQSDVQQAERTAANNREQVAQAQREPVNTERVQQAVGNIIDVVA